LVSIVLKMGWFELEVFGILSSYLNHLYWLYRILGSGGAQGHDFSGYHASTALLLFYWAAFRVSYVVRKIKSSADENMSTIAALLNTLLLLGTMKFQSVHPELAFYALLAIGAIEFTIAQLPITKQRRQAFILLTIVGTALMVTAIPFRYSGNNVSILWLVGAEALLLAGAIFDEVVFRRLVAVAIRDRCLNIWAATAVGLVHAYDPELIVIGGGVMKRADVIIPYLESYVHKYSWTPWGKVQVRAAELGNNAVLMGAVPLLSQDIPANE
jgi:ROK family